MLISASRRTDIPSHYTEWFLNRITEKYVMVRNPMNYHQISRIDLSPEVIDGIVLWSKNPKPMLERIPELKDYAYYFQYTLNPYGQDVETNLPRLEDRINTFKRLSDKIGKERLLWRYDPVLISSKYTIEYHTEMFNKMMYELKDYTEKCTFSYIDSYPSMEASIRKLNIVTLSLEEELKIAHIFSDIAKENHLKLYSCAEKTDLSCYGIGHTSCIDIELLERINGCKISAVKDKNQRQECGCAESIDIGYYNTCKNGCIYCYANHSKTKNEKNTLKYAVNSPLLCTTLTAEDSVAERKMKSLKDPQYYLF